MGPSHDERALVVVRSESLVEQDEALHAAEMREGNQSENLLGGSANGRESAAFKHTETFSSASLYVATPFLLSMKGKRSPLTFHPFFASSPAASAADDP